MRARIRTFFCRNWELPTKRPGLILFFALVFGYTWGLGVLAFVPATRAILGPVTFANPLVASAVWSPSLAALLVSALQGRKGFSDLMTRLFTWRIAWYWYVGPVAAIAAMSLVAELAAARVFGARLPLVPAAAQLPSLVGSALLAFAYDPGPLGEELGWRGFALPRLLERMNGLSAALLLGTIWAVWHLPAFFIPGMPQNNFPIWTFMIAVIGASVIITWVVNRACGSVLPAILIHWSVNRFGNLAPPTAIMTALVFAATALALVAIAGVDLGARRERATKAPKPLPAAT